MAKKYILFYCRIVSLNAWIQTHVRGASVVWRLSSMGFIDVHIEDNEARIVFVNEKGEELYAFRKTNPRSVV